jgi:hypothetical protein
VKPRRVFPFVISILVWGCGSTKSDSGASGTGSSGASGAASGTTTSSGIGGAGGTAGTANVGGAADGGGGSGATDGGPSDATADIGNVDAARGTWPPVNDYGAPGPFTVQRDNDTGPGGAYDVFRPAMLGPSPRKNPIVSWANGTLFGIDMYQTLLRHWASHGFVVIAAHSQSTAGGATHKAGIDWLLAENSRASSLYFGTLDTMAIGAAGHSQGGGATIAAGSNKPGPTGITATLPLMPILSFETDKTIVMRQAAPMFNVNATMDNRDPTGAVANQIYDGANRELVQAAFIGIHEDAMNPAMNAPTLAWFRFKLMADDRARSFFYPANACDLCRDAAYEQVRYKNTP